MADDLNLCVLVVFLFAVEALLVLLESRFLLIELVFEFTEVLASLVDQLVSAAGVLDGLLPLQVELVTLLMQALELLSRLVELDLSGLGLSDFLLELLALGPDFDSQFLDLQSQLLDLGFISASVLLKSEVVFLLLSSGEGPLFELLLIPVHLEFELIHALVGLEDHVLDVVQTVLLVSNALLELLNLIFETA